MTSVTPRGEGKGSSTLLSCLAHAHRMLSGALCYVAISSMRAVFGGLYVSIFLWRQQYAIVMNAPKKSQQ